MHTIAFEFVLFFISEKHLSPYSELLSTGIFVTEISKHIRAQIFKKFGILLFHSTIQKNLGHP